MTDKESTSQSIRNEPWFKQAPEWLGEVIVQLTANREGNLAMEARLDSMAKVLNDISERLANREIVLADKEKSLLSAVADLRDFANTLYGPGSALQQIHVKLEEIKLAQDRDRSQNNKRFEGLELAQEETDDRMGEFQKRMDGMDMEFKARLDSLNRRLDSIGH